MLPIRFLAALATVAPVWGQAIGPFTGLATPYDGSVVYFASTLALKGSNQPNYGKLFIADENGVRLFRLLDEIDPAPSPVTCVPGTQYAILGADITADGRTIAAQGQLTHTGYCNIYLSATDLISPAGERELQGYVRLSPQGRYAIVDTTMGPYSSATAQFLDLKTGSQTPIPLPAVAGPWPLNLPAGRAIADDGTAVFRYYNSALLSRPGQELQPFPVSQATPLAIDASGTRILYATDDIRLLDLPTQNDRLVLAGLPDAVCGMSDDGQRVLFLQGTQAYIVRTDGTDRGSLTSDPAGISWAILSGSGKIAYAVTGAGRLLKIDVDTGVQIELIGRTPYLNGGTAADAGMAASISGTGLSDVSLGAAPPLPLSLANVTVRIDDHPVPTNQGRQAAAQPRKPVRTGGRRVPISQVTPTQVGFLVPWDIQLAGSLPAETRVTVEAPGQHSPFDFPETLILIGSQPRAGDIAHQNWDGLVSNDSPAHAGEIIHIWAVGLGAVNPEIPPGAVAPSAEPLARLAAPLVCSDSEVLYAGLVPGYLERVYQVDLRLSSHTGYLRYTCSGAGMDYPLLLTLLVVP
jgi:uncharacterized protein (TIGR03437 family)